MTTAVQHAAPQPASSASGALANPFVQTLIRLIRAQDSYGAWEGKPDTELLAPFILTKEQRRALPIVGDPDPDVLARIDMFYNALSLSIERETGLIASPMMKMSHEGFGRVILTMGKLVVYSKHLRDAHRFGFESLEKLAAEGDKAVAQAVETFKTWPDVAKA